MAKRRYPLEFIREVPDWLDSAKPLPSCEELARASGIIAGFLHRGVNPPYMLDIIRGFRLIRNARRYAGVGTAGKGNIAYASHLLAENAKIYDIDDKRDPEMTIKARKMLKANQELITIIGQSDDPATIRELTVALGEEKLDAVFIDADHAADSVLGDYAAYSPMVRDGGVVMIHDVYWRGDDAAFGSSIAMEQIDRLRPVYVVFADHPIHRFLPWLTKSDCVWGGIGISRIQKD